MGALGGLLLSLIGFPFKALGRALASLFAWVMEDSRHVAIALLVLALIGTGWLGYRAGADRDTWQGRATTAARNAVGWKANAGAWKAAHGKLIADVKAARKAAAVADKANIDRIARDYAAIHERTAHDYQDRLADTRTAYERVRASVAAIAARDPRERGNAPVPEPLAARCRALGAADCDALLATLPGQLAAAEYNTSRLIGLQDYVRSMLLLDFSGVRSGDAEAQEGAPQ